MPNGWERKKVLITVRTYPVPATKSIEASCTAGVTDSGEWIRLFPIPFRLMADENRFSKWQWIAAEAIKASNDPRPESYKLNSEAIVLGEKVAATDGWRTRKELLRSLIRKSMCQIRREQEARGSPTLGVFRPARIKRLILAADDATWTEAQLGILNQNDLFRKTPALTLEKIPFKFKYEFLCDDPSCRGHEMSCTDWEMAQAYRRWRREYGADWERAFREKFERDMIEKYETHFFVGTIHQHPNNWIIVGLFYPPKQESVDLFDL